MPEKLENNVLLSYLGLLILSGRKKKEWKAKDCVEEDTWREKFSWRRVGKLKGLETHCQK